MQHDHFLRNFSPHSGASWTSALRTSLWFPDIVRLAPVCLLALSPRGGPTCADTPRPAICAAGWGEALQASKCWYPIRQSSLIIYYFQILVWKLALHPPDILPQTRIPCETVALPKPSLQATTQNVNKNHHNLLFEYFSLAIYLKMHCLSVRVQRVTKTGLNFGIKGRML
jgi:hypothetical protein